VYAVMVKHSARKRICTSGLVWVKDERTPYYVALKERGLWNTKAEAARAITDPCEVVVEVNGDKCTT
jgi:hypothetical protein